MSIPTEIDLQSLLVQAEISHQGVDAAGNHQFEMRLPSETTQLKFMADSGTLHCQCQSMNGTDHCQHVDLLKLWRAQQNSSSGTSDTAVSSPSTNGKSMPPPPVGNGNANGRRTASSINGSQANSGNNGTAPQPPSGNGATPPRTAPEIPSEVSVLAARMLVPWGKFKGRSLAQLAATPEGQSYLFFIARKSEPKNDGDRDLVKAADAVMMALVDLDVAQAAANPDQFTPILPFSEDKGKPLHKAHPKWAAILSKKSDEDARSFQDLVLYRVAKSLHAKRGGGFGRSGGGLTPQQFEQLLTELRGIRSALEKAVSQ